MIAGWAFFFAVWAGEQRTAKRPVCCMFGEGSWGNPTLEVRRPHALQSVMPQRHFGVCEVPQAVHCLPDSSGSGGAVLRGLRGFELFRLVPGRKPAGVAKANGMPPGILAAIICTQQAEAIDVDD